MTRLVESAAATHAQFRQYFVDLHFFFSMFLATETNLLKNLQNLRHKFRFLKREASDTFAIATTVNLLSNEFLH